MSNSAISTVYIANPETHYPTPYIVVKDEREVVNFDISGIVLHDIFDSSDLSIKFISNQTGEVLNESDINFPDDKATNKELSDTLSVTKFSAPKPLHLPVHISNVQIGKTYKYTVKLFEDGIEIAHSSCAVCMTPESLTED